MNARSWSESDLQAPHTVTDKARRVRAMFTAIAPTYDLNNRLHSLGLDQHWRRETVRLSCLRQGDRVLDVACGTGDLTLAYARCLNQLQQPAALAPGQVLGVDFTFAMLPLARHKAGKLFPSAGPENARAGVTFSAGDATCLPLADACVEVTSIAFGLRNVAQPERALAEFYRVLKPGGRLLILEFSLPTNPILRGLYQFYFTQVLPRTAGWIAGDKTGAYRYLPRSVNTYVSRGEMQQMIRAAGFSAVEAHPLTFGIAVVYVGKKGQGDEAKGQA